MSENQHTPGPWRVAGQGKEQRLPILRPDGKRIASVEEEGSLRDARLIAAAPEMVGLLEQVAALWLRDPSPDDPGRGLAQKARALLARIKGTDEQPLCPAFNEPPESCPLTLEQCQEEHRAR